MPKKTKRVGIDVVGTFTDTLIRNETGLPQKFKTLTTPSDPSKGFMGAFEKAANHCNAGDNQFLGQIEALVELTLATKITFVHSTSGATVPAFGAPTGPGLSARHLSATGRRRRVIK